MTTANATLPFRNDSQFNTRSWVGGVKDLITTAGLVETNDTGQLDWTSMAQANSSSNLGYMMFRFPDSQQSSMPIFIKLVFSTDNANRCYVSAAVGSSTDGAGSLPSTILTSSSASGPQWDNYPCFVSYKNGTFAMVIGYGANPGGTANNAVCSLVIDRTRDASGAATAQGFLVEGSTSQTGTSRSRSYYGPASPALDSGFIPALIPGVNATNTAEGPNVNVFRHYSMTPGVHPHVGMLTYVYGELGALVPITVTVLGSQHTYLPMGYAMNYWSAVPTANHCAAIRWE